MSLAVGFQGARLLEARRARAISAVDLGAMTGVSSQSISKYENGHQIPRREVLDRVATVLTFPIDYFFRQPQTEDARPVFWRSKMSAQSVDLERALVRLEWLKEMVDYLSQFFDYPQLNLLDLNVPADPLKITSEFLEEAANEVRRSWNAKSGPLPDCLEKIEASGILVSRIHVRAEKVDAFSQWSDRFSTPFIVLSRDKASAARQRFDALHELAHVLLHKKVTEAQLNNRSVYKTLEHQADEFASYMLLPEQAFLEELYAPTLDGMLSLKERWGVSVAAMIMRCRSLGILDDESAKRLWINYTRRGWRKGEPFDGKMTKEAPHLIRRSVEMLLAENVQTVADLRKALPFPAEDLEELSDVEPGSLGATVSARPDPVLKPGVGASRSNVVSLFGKKS